MNCAWMNLGRLVTAVSVPLSLSSLSISTSVSQHLNFWETYLEVFSLSFSHPKSLKKPFTLISIRTRRGHIIESLKLAIGKEDKAKAQRVVSTGDHK